MKHILLCLDSSVYARSVCEHAAWVAKRTDASVELLHVVNIRERPADKTRDLSGNIGVQTLDHLMSDMVEQDRARNRTAQEIGRHLLDEGRAILKEAGVGNTTITLRNGALVDVVHNLSAKADLIVLGKRGEGADFASGHLGSNLERVVRAIDRPCLVAPRAFKPINRMLIAFDGGKTTRRAVSYVASSPVRGAKSRAGMRLSEVASALCGPDLFQACRFQRKSPFPSCRVATLRPWPNACWRRTPR